MVKKGNKEDQSSLRIELDKCNENYAVTLRMLQELAVTLVNITGNPFPITEIFDLEQQELGGLTGDLINTLQENSITMMQSVDSAQATTKAKARMLANMSHEIRTPLNSIIGMAELLQLSSVNKDQKRYVNNILHSGELLLEIINEILDYSKGEAGKIAAEKLRFSLEDLLSSVIDMLAGKCHQKKIEIAQIYSPGVPEFFQGDPVKIKQMLTNVANNAIKFTDQGFVLVEVHRAEDGIDLVVEDSGIGIEQSKISELFEAYTQEEVSTSRNFGGTGLGLAITQSLVDSMGGKITVESEKGKGTKFTIFLPLVPTEDIVGPKMILKKRILVVSQAKQNNCLIETVCSSFSVAVKIVADADRAWHELIASEMRSEQYDIVFIDLDLPLLEGHSFARKLSVVRRTEKVILLTSLGKTYDMGSTTQDLKASGTLTKPLSAKRLKTRMLSIWGMIADDEDKAVSTEDFKEDWSKIKVLVADDNEQNLELFKYQFQLLGCKPVFVVNGEEAAAKAMSQEFDMIFMDLQMPKMNGIEATQYIRTQEEAWQHVPIVALTASILEEDKKACLQAGMDDFMVKPVRKKDLEMILRRWALGLTQNKPAAPSSVAKSGKQDKKDKKDKKENALPVYDQSKAMEIVDDNMEMWGFLKTMFTSRIPEQIVELADFVKNADIAQIRELAHKIKGSAGAVAAVSVEQAALELEKAAYEKKPIEEISPLFEQLKHVMEITEAYVE